MQALDSTSAFFYGFPGSMRRRRGAGKQRNGFDCIEHRVVYGRRNMFGERGSVTKSPEPWHSS